MVFFSSGCHYLRRLLWALILVLSLWFDLIYTLLFFFCEVSLIKFGSHYASRTIILWLWRCFNPTPPPRPQPHAPLPKLPHPVVYSTDHSKAVVLVLFLLFVALWFPHCLFFFCFVLFIYFFFYMCCDASIVVTSSIAAHYAFCFASCVVMLAFWSPSTAANFAFCFTSCN